MVDDIKIERVNVPTIDASGKDRVKTWISRTFEVVISMINKHLMI